MSTTADFSLVAGFLDGIRPDRQLTVSQWADKHRVLSATSSAEPGQWRTERTPYLRDIMDCLSANSAVQQVVVKKAAQVGMTEAGNNWVGYVIDHAPGPMLFVMSTVDLAEKNSKMRLDPMLRDTPSLSKKVMPARSRDSGNTKFLKEFPGGILSLTGANSAAGLRSMPARYIFLDEVDSYPLDLEGEGNPIELAKARSRTFARRKIFILSTPTLAGQSIIDTEFETTDQRFYQVPCPECGFLQILDFAQLRWQPGKHTDLDRYQRTTRYECKGCGYHIEERFKTPMLAAGVWVQTKPENASHARVGFHINALYSPFGWFSWAEIAQAYDKAEASGTKDEDMKTFVNTVLGEPYEQPGEVPPWKALFERRLDYAQNQPPDGVCLITAGADVQADRIEIEIVGWGKGRRSWSLDYRIFYGDPAKELGVWQQVAELLDEVWVRADQVEIPIYKLCIDSGYATSQVYDFCSKWPANRVMPIKGQDSLAVAVSAPRAVLKTNEGKDVQRSTRVWGVGSSFLKSRVYGWLRLERLEDGSTPPGWCEFPQYDELYFRGLTAEQLVFSMSHGYKKYNWVKKFDRNEPLDCRVYATAGACIAGVDRWTDADYDAQVALLPVRTTEQRDAAKIGPKKRRPSQYW